MHNIGLVSEPCIRRVAPWLGLRCIECRSAVSKGRRPFTQRHRPLLALRVGSETAGLMLVVEVAIEGEPLPAMGRGADGVGVELHRASTGK